MLSIFDGRSPAESGGCVLCRNSFNSRMNPPPAASHTSLALHTGNLRKVFGSKVAVRGLSLGVPRGEV
ncbi:MAG: hypothetical protein ACRD3Y_09310, partial [Bryobacteraceae bacterium]